MFIVVITISAIICQLEIVTAVTIREKDLSIPKFYGTDNLIDAENGRLLIASCEGGNTFRRKKCIVVAEKEYDSNDTYKCNITLISDKNKIEFIAPVDFIRRFGKNRAILVSTVKNRRKSTEYTMISILNLRTCKFKSGKFNHEKSTFEHGPRPSIANSGKFFFATYPDDVLEVIFKNPSDDDETRITKTILDFKRKKESRELEFLENENVSRIWSIEPLTKNSSDPRYLYIYRNEEEVFYNILQSNGSRQFLTSFKRDFIRFGTSTIHDLITICTQLYYLNEIRCTQYDINGKLKSETKLESPGEDITKIRVVHNLRKGGFILGYETGHDDLITPIRSQKNKQFLAMYNVEGKLIGSEQENKPSTNWLSLLKTDKDNWHSIFENEKGEYCLLKMSTTNHITHKCYNDSEFPN